MNTIVEITGLPNTGKTTKAIQIAAVFNTDIYLLGPEPVPPVPSLENIKVNHIEVYTWKDVDLFVDALIKRELPAVVIIDHVTWFEFDMNSLSATAVAKTKNKIRNSKHIGIFVTQIRRP